MKIFTRSSKGVNNQHLFYKVDYVLYLEGGTKSYSLAEVLAGMHSCDTDDTVFWNKIFVSILPKRKIKFKSVGSKAVVKEIAELIVKDNLTHVLVGMDNEFDEVLSRRFSHRNILYTHGYSWENDIWNEKVVVDIINDLTASPVNIGDIHKNFNDFEKSIKIGVFADGYLFSKGSSFFPKNGHLFCVNCVPIDLPTVKVAEINKKIIAKGLKRTTLYSFASRKKIKCLKHCYGHLIADYCCQLVMHYLGNRMNLPGMKKHIIYRMGISKYFSKMFNSGEVYDHYFNQLSAI